MKTSGFFKLHRSMFDNPAVMKDADYFITWVYILAQAEWEDGKKVDFGGEVIELKAGQFTTGVSGQMLDDLKKVNNDLNVSKLNRVLKKFKTEKQIEQRTDHQCSLITVLNWDRYQNSEQRNEQRVNNDRTTSEQRVNTNKEYKEKKEDKEVKKDLSNDKSDIYPVSHHKKIVDEWNTLSDLGIKTLRSITPNSNREKNLKARLKEFGEDSFKEIVDHIRHSKYLQGKVNGWKVDFDWVVLPSNYQKVLDGKYDDKTEGNPQSFNMEEFLRRFDE